VQLSSERRRRVTRDGNQQSVVRPHLDAHANLAVPCPLPVIGSAAIPATPPTVKSRRNLALADIHRVIGSYHE
jgi:hypothetical protein